MKKTVLFLILGCMANLLSAQNEIGKLYSQHESIQKSRDMWAAIVRNDKEAVSSFLADTVWVVTNGVAEKMTGSTIATNIDWWKGFDHFAVTEDKPATPDALVYDDAKTGTYVHDWLRMTGIHKETGVKMDLPVHFIYSFNAKGKIRAILRYFDPTLLQTIKDNTKTIENGKVYINHPYIVLARKSVNAYCAKDLNTLLAFYSPEAKFYYASNKWGKGQNLEQKKKSLESTFAENETIRMDQVGYPDCIYYEREGLWAVFSWWSLSLTGKTGGKKSDIPVMMIQSFDKEGKIMEETYWFSSNHLQ